ncbi:MAG: ABC transporter substrate-binding protein [Acidimicrobiales bacterium]
MIRRSGSFRRSMGGLAAMGLSMAMMLAGCTSGGTTGSAVSPVTSAPASAIRGQTISVLLPPWGQVPQSLLDQFTAQTGVHVNLQTGSFDAIHQRIAIASAGGTPLADVTEMDWSWVGQFGGAGWYVPLQKGLSASTVSGMVNRGNFEYHGQLYGACYSNDFRLGDYNTKDFARAGITGPPTTFSQLLTDVEAIKAKGVAQYPLDLELSARAGTTDVWMAITHAMGGQILGAGDRPVFARPGSIAEKALAFEIDAYRHQLVSPAALSLSSTTSGQQFLSGAVSVALDGGPGDLKAAANPSLSNIVGSAGQFLMPGTNGPGNTIGLPEALGIMSTSHHKAAALAFIRWWMKPSTEVSIYNQLGLYPCGKAALGMLQASGQVLGGSTLQAEVAHIVPTFSGGTPPWFSTFSTDAATDINAVAEGSLTVTSALAHLARQVNTLRQGSS